MLFCALLISFLCNAQQTENFISWDTTHLLKWDDFKGEPNGSSPYLAYTFSGFGYNTSYIGNDFTVVVYSRFDKTKSWKTQKITDALLKHEQCHFDITEIFSRIFTKKIQERGVVSKNKFNKDVQDIMKEVSSDLKKFNDLYDDETNHSQNTAKQKEWEDKIEKMLDKYKQYSKREVNFHF